jgi:hypothetical protein
MRFLTAADYRTEAEPALRKVFLNDSLCYQQFGVNAESRKFLYEYSPPDREIIEAIARAASNLGDDGFYLSVLGIQRFDEAIEFDNWWISFSEVSIYLSNNSEIFHYADRLEHAIYSPQGKWGLMWTFGCLGILAGVDEFVGQVCQYLPQIERRARDYLKDISESKTEWGEHISVIDRLDWIPGLFDRIYGRESTEKMLQEVGLYETNLFQPRPPLFRPSLEMRGTAKFPLGTKRGLEELQVVLEASEPTNEPSTRRVVISRHQGLPEPFASMEPGSTAIRVFFMMAAPDSHSTLTLDSSEYQQAKLSNGGTIRLRRTQIEENNNSYYIHEIYLQNHGILGYDRVNKIEFIAQEIPSL